MKTIKLYQVNWKLPNIKDVIFDIDWVTMSFSNFIKYDLENV